MGANANVYWSDVVATAEIPTPSGVPIVAVDKVAINSYAQNVLVVATVQLHADADATQLNFYADITNPADVGPFDQSWTLVPAPDAPQTYTVSFRGQLPVGVFTIYVFAFLAGASGPSAVDVVTATVFVGD